MVGNKLPAVQRLILSGVVAGMLATGIVAVRAGLGDIQTMRARWQVGQWQNNPGLRPKPAEIGRARNDLVAGLEWLPGDPQILESLAYLYGARAHFARGLPELENAMLDEAIAYYRAALVKRPMLPYPWANIAFGLHLRNIEPGAMWQAFDGAVRYGRREGGVQIRLVQIGISRWNEAGEARRQIVRQIVAEARGRARKEILALLEAAGRNDLLPVAG